MTINELVVFIGLVCNLDAPSSLVSREVKDDCVEYYTNCVIKDDAVKVDRLTVSNCNLKAKEASKSWGR